MPFQVYFSMQNIDLQCTVVTSLADDYTTDLEAIQAAYTNSIGGKKKEKKDVFAVTIIQLCLSLHSCTNT